MSLTATQIEQVCREKEQELLVPDGRQLCFGFQ